MNSQHVKAKLTSKGQLTIPKTIRDLLKVDEGDSIQFVIESNNEIYIQKALTICPVCSGKGTTLEQPCFFCLEAGDLSELFDPFAYQPIWFQRYGVDTNLTLTSKNGQLIPSIDIKSNSFSTELLALVEDAIMLILYKNYLINEEQNPPTFKTHQIQKLWNKYLG